MADRTTKTPAESGRSTSNGHATPRVNTIVPPKRRVRLPELAVGLLVTVAFGLGAVLWHLSTVSKVPALTVLAAVERGETIDAEDLRVVYVASDDPLARLDANQTAMVVGRVALVDLTAGTLLTPSLVADATALQAGDGVVGLALEPGQYPGLALAPGDRVNVVRSADTETAGGGADFVVARGATVSAVEELASDRRLVSILLREGDAEAVASEAGTGSLRLVLVAP